MTISNQRVKDVYVADGRNRNWEWSFSVLSTDDIKIKTVTDDGVEEDVNTAYKLDTINKIVIYPTEESDLAPLAKGTKVVLYRQTPITQDIDLIRQGNLDAETLENGYDKRTLVEQELAEKLGRAIKFPLGDVRSTNAAEYLDTVTTSAKNALQSAQSAKLSEGNAKNSEELATMSAEFATQKAEQAVLAAETATLSANAALESEASAKISEENAAESESSAKESEIIASEKASLAYESAASALNSADKAENAQLIAESAAIRAENAAESVKRVMEYKGSVATFEDLPFDSQVGDVWNVSDTGSNYAWDGEKWDKFSEIVDLSGYQTKLTAGKGITIEGNVISASDSGTIETEITEDSTDTTVPSSKAVWDKVNVLEDRFVEGNPDYVVEGTGNLATIGNRAFIKKNDGLAYGMVCQINNYNGCILVSEIPEAVIINPPSYAAEGSFEYAGRTWYYSPDEYFMPSSNNITLGLLKVIKTDTPFSTPLEAAKYVIENGLNYKVNGLVTDVTNVKEDVSKLANAYTSSNLKAGTNIALTKTGYHKILSNFSSTKYVKFLKKFNPANTYKMIVGLTTGSSVTTTQSILSVQGVDRNFYLKGSGSVFSYYHGSSVAGSTVATANTAYWLVFDYDGTTCKLYLAKDDGTYVNPKDLPALTDSFWTEELSSTIEIFKGKNLQLGKNGSTTAYWFGSINLGKVLITADGDEWFNGLTAEEGIDYTNLGCTVTNERVEGLEVATTIDCLITKTSQLENDSGFLTSAEGAGASFPLFYHTFADHILNDASWLRGDTFSWQSGDVYVSAYNHLVEDYESTKVSTDIVVDGVQYYAWKNEENIVYTKDLLPSSETTIYAMDEGSLVEAPYTFHSSTTSQLDLVANTYIQIEDTPTTIPFTRYSEMVNGTKSETIGSTTIEYATATDGHKIVLADQEEAVSAIFAETGVAWYYILDTENKRFKLPRTKWAFTGLRNTVGNFVEAGLPNITGSMSQQGNRGGIASVDGAFYGEGTTGIADASGQVSGPLIIKFDPSRSSEVYGKSETVQPNATEQYLYFYVGNTVRNQTEIDVGALTEEVNKIHDYVTESYNDGNGNWWEKYKSGKVRQGGLIAYSQERDARKQVTLLLPMKDANYFCSVTGRSIYRSDTDLFAFNTAVGNITTTGFLAHIYGLSEFDFSDGMFWIVEGKGAE